ncbi:putative transposase [Heyndrickxia coagulans DSM 1 = ATCC 7050]|nr:putative transposase [Heyndrickxia coagulans DSM 1 = ATCC 7050]
MLAMPEIHHIKHLREKKGLSLSEIVRRTGFNWRTVKKYADGDISVRQKIKRKRGMMEEEGYGQIIDDWLEEDAKLPRKQQRTSKKMYEQLKQEHGFKGSYRTVCAYVQKRRPQLKLEKERRYERLEHPPGEAQVDFGTMSVVTKEGKEEDRSILILSFPYSNAAYAYPLPAENSECFLYGLTQLFRQAGGVPRKLRIDNWRTVPGTVRHETIFNALTGYTEKRNEVHLFHSLNKLLKSTKCIYMNFLYLKKTYPSNGARHTLDIFAIHNNKILYLSPLLDDWEIVDNFQYDDSLLIVTCTYERMQWKYRNHIFYRDILLELGHLKEILEFLGIRETKRDKKREIVDEFNRRLNFRDFYTEVNGIYEIDR